ncbi:MAG: type II toxin-antitoxin system prevent-host-death family antitoxin [Verrucomicrobia bacterium]|nr:type II toxin-antitoxin system prevent-host-death family antitoxin [Verrucomicrobiota bacterium]
MKSVTVREAQHNLAKVLKTVENGETVEIMRRNVPVARLSPVPQPGEGPVDWSDHAGRLSAIWGAKQVTGLDETLDALRGDR